MNTRSLAKMGPWEQSGHISLVPTLWHRHQRKGKVVWIIFFVKGKWKYVDVGSQLEGEAGNQLAFTFNPGNDLWVHWHVEWMLYHTKAPTVNVLTYQIEAPTGHLNSMRGLRQPGQASHMWRIATIFVGLSCVCINICQKCVDNICQSGSQVFASPAHPSALDNHTLSDGPRTENPEDQYVLCCNIKLFGFEMFRRWCSFQIGFHSKSK